MDTLGRNEKAWRITLDKRLILILIAVGFFYYDTLLKVWVFFAQALVDYNNRIHGFLNSLLLASPDFAEDHKVMLFLATILVFHFLVSSNILGQDRNTRRQRARHYMTTLILSDAILLFLSFRYLLSNSEWPLHLMLAIALLFIRSGYCLYRRNNTRPVVSVVRVMLVGEVLAYAGFLVWYCLW